MTERRITKELNHGGAIIHGADGDIVRREGHAAAQDFQDGFLDGPRDRAVEELVLD